MENDEISQLWEYVKYYVVNNGENLELMEVKKGIKPESYEIQINSRKDVAAQIDEYARFYITNFIKRIELLESEL